MLNYDDWQQGQADAIAAVRAIEEAHGEFGLYALAGALAAAMKMPQKAPTLCKERMIREAGHGIEAIAYLLRG